MPLDLAALPTSRLDGDANHTAGHNATNTAVNTIAAYLDSAIAAAVAAEAAARVAGDAAQLVLPFPTHLAGKYDLPVSTFTSSTSAALGVGTLRVVPWVLRRSITIDRLGGEVGVVGQAGSQVRFGIYLDNGACYPGALLVDGGVIAGDVATVQDCPTLGSPLVLPAGVLWVGGVVQLVTTTQPSVRTVANWNPEVPISGAATIPGATAGFCGYSQGSVTGALPANFSTSVGPIGTAPRPHVKVTAVAA